MPKKPALAASEFAEYFRKQMPEYSIDDEVKTFPNPPGWKPEPLPDYPPNFDSFKHQSPQEAAADLDRTLHKIRADVLRARRKAIRQLIKREMARVFVCNAS